MAAGGACSNELKDGSKLEVEKTFSASTGRLTSSRSRFLCARQVADRSTETSARVKFSLFSRRGVLVRRPSRHGRIHIFTVALVLRNLTPERPFEKKDSSPWPRNIT